MTGDAGRAMLVGGRMGERGCGALRELAERGERTWSACLVREATRGAGAAFARFLGLERSSFSLSIISPLVIVSSDLNIQGRACLPVAFQLAHGRGAVAGISLVLLEEISGWRSHVATSRSHSW